jgi:hypothetical protein
MSVSEYQISLVQAGVKRLHEASDRMPTCHEIAWEWKHEQERLRLMQQQYALSHHPARGGV